MSIQWLWGNEYMVPTIWLYWHSTNADQFRHCVMVAFHWPWPRVARIA